MRFKFNIITVFFALFVIFSNVAAQAAVVEYDLTISEQIVNFTGKSAQGMTINGAIPGPVLHFTEGDIARIHVSNNMSVNTSIHWHGVLVPPGMDGVPYVSFPPIAPGTTFTYEFPIRQSGTYWYHSHTSLQEQSGVYGGIVIKPREQDKNLVDHDHVVLFSDWTDEDPHTVLRTLKRGSDWYAIAKGSGQSIFGAIRLGMLNDYFNRELQRMPAMDIADVAYDRFLANGEQTHSIPAKPGETLHLRLIDGSASTFFYVEFAGGPMTIISADGQNVAPFDEQRFLIAVAETYDVLIKVPDQGAYELRATAHDGSAHASVWIGTGKKHFAPDIPQPNLYHVMGTPSFKQIFALTPAGSMGMSNKDVRAGKFDKPGMAMMHGDGMHEMDDMHDMSNEPAEHMMHQMDMSSSSEHAQDTTHTQVEPNTIYHEDSPVMNMPNVNISGKSYAKKYGLMATDISSATNLAIDGVDASRPWPPYAKLRATQPTTLPKDQPIREIRMTLDGDMERYVWSINNKILSETDSIHIKEGEVVRFIMINRTMMHHPMHLHGHFFRVINEQGEYSPLKHTVDVAPMSTTVIEFEANEVGDWFFHCHILYHMKAGMTRVVEYDEFILSPEMSAIRPELYKDDWYFSGQTDVLSNMNDGFVRLSNTRNILTAAWEVGWQGSESGEWEGILTWDRYFNRFFTAFVGANVGTSIEEERGILGMRYLLPLNIETQSFIGTDGGARLGAGKSFHLTPRLMLLADTEYDTETKWESKVKLSYLINQYFALAGQFHSDYDFGAGVQIQF